MKVFLRISACVSAILVIPIVVGLTPPRAHADTKAPPAAKDPVELNIQTVLDWLPTDTETLMVANGPFEMRWRDPARADSEPAAPSASLSGHLENLQCGNLGSLRQGQLLKSLNERVVALAVHGARKFRVPKQLGLAPYEGCDCLIFRRGLGDRAPLLQKALAASVGKQEKIAGIDVFSFQEKLERDLWTFYVAVPRPNVLLCATDRGYLTDVLNRVESPKPIRPRAFPAELPEWKHVDLKARFWAIRHYVKRDETLPLFQSFVPNQPGSIGEVFVFNPGQKNPGQKADKALPKVTYILESKEELQTVIHKEWLFAGAAGAKTDVQKLNPGVFQLTAELTNEEQTVMFLLMLLAQLGHVIAL